MYRTAEALRDAMIALGVACDGGKDSLSMAAPAGTEVVMAPGNLVISAYAGCPDITKVVTPDIKAPGNYLLHVDIAKVPLTFPLPLSNSPLCTVIIQPVRQRRTWLRCRARRLLQRGQRVSEETHAGLVCGSLRARR